MKKDYSKAADATRYMFFICISFIVFIFLLFAYELWGPPVTETKVLTPEIIHSILNILSFAMGAMGNHLYNKLRNGNEEEKKWE